MTLIEILDPVEEEAAGLTAEEIQEEERCTKQHVQSAVKIAKSRFVQAGTGRYTAVTVLIKEEAKIVEDLILKKDDHFDQIAQELEEAETISS